MADNSISLLENVIRALAGADVKTWIFGGWAEEFSGLRPPGPHQDIDLLYLAQNFEMLDNFLRTRGDVEEIGAKRFTHKRAFEWRGVRVEVFLVRDENLERITDFFGSHRFLWPSDTFLHSVALPCGEFPSASLAALRLFREHHADVDAAYRRHVALSGTA